MSLLFPLWICRLKGRRWRKKSEFNWNRVHKYQCIIWIAWPIDFKMTWNDYANFLSRSLCKEENWFLLIPAWWRCADLSHRRNSAVESILLVEMRFLMHNHKWKIAHSHLCRICVFASVINVKRNCIMNTVAFKWHISFGKFYHFKPCQSLKL